MTSESKSLDHLPAKKTFACNRNVILQLLANNLLHAKGICISRFIYSFCHRLI